MRSVFARRLFVLAIYGGFAALVALLYGQGLDKMMLDSFPGAILGVASWGGIGLFVLQRHYWSWGHAPAETLDERQLSTRLNAYWAAYTILGTLVFVGLVGLSLASDLLRIDNWRPEYAPAAVWGVFLLIMTLPNAILMWNDRPAVYEGE